MLIYLIRHADPDYANQTITAAGHLEAQALAKRLQKERLDHIYSSSMGRALHTMRYTADAAGLAPTVEEWMVELGKKWYYYNADGDKQMAWNVPGETIRGGGSMPNHADWHLQPPFDRPEFIGHHAELKEQSDRFPLKHGYRREGGRYRIMRPNEEKVAVFCHLAFGLAWLAHLLELPLTLVWGAFWIAPSSVTTVLMEQRSDHWAVPRCLGVGDVSHIYESGLPVSLMGLHGNRK